MMKKLFLLVPLLLLSACFNYGPMPGDEKYLVAAKYSPSAKEAVYIAETSLYLSKWIYNPFLGSKYNRTDGILFVTPTNLVFVQVSKRTGRFKQFYGMRYREIEELNVGSRDFYPVIFGEKYPFSLVSQVNSQGQEVPFSEVEEYIKKQVKAARK